MAIDLDILHPPRDITGYGEFPPDPLWPNGAKIAVSFVLNYEEGAESNVQDGDDFAENYLCDAYGFEAYYRKRNPVVESFYEYGSRAGFWRILRAFEKRKMTCTVFACGMALEKNPEAANAMHDAGFEIASHGYRWLEYRNIAPEVEREHILTTIKVHEKMFNEKPLGFYQGRPSSASRQLAAEAGCFTYDNDAYSDDLPYWDYNFKNPILILPYNIACNDMKFVALHGVKTGEEYFVYLKSTLEALHEKAACTPKMMTIGLHCRVVGRPGRMRGLAKFLDYLNERTDVWICTRADIAAHWRSLFPPRKL